MSQVAMFSVRLVTADYYLSKPIPELDVQFSEFRGSEVKQLPILRVFGATPQGNKTCLHIHGVFPYLYIPCEDPNPEPKIAYQIANSIDRALNISLKQANSTNQHVYKVILVQGIPFYGFHTKVHQFYKIFFYNPSFIKRVSDLLQNGAILGLSYQPHEAHINFTMQFFLDFNLYGMSFINLEYIKFRRKNAQMTEEKHSHLSEHEYLPETIQFTSCCEYEGDCLAQHILNRKDVIHGNLGANPGLEALWEDEKQRLNNMNMSDTLIPTPTQVRDNVPPTDSHLYNSRKLLVKLALNSETQNESVDHNNMTLSILNDTERERSSIEFTPEALKENPSTVLSKVVYPAETPDESQILNATSVMLHHPSSKVSKRSNACDESVVLEFSQNQTLSQVNLDSDDMDLMNMLKDMETIIEEDSILGTQTKQDVEEDEIEEEINNFNERFTEEDFNMTVNEDIEPSQASVWNDTFWDNVQNISQLDGSWDVEDKQSTTPQSKRKKNLKVGLSKPKKKIPLIIKEEKSLRISKTQYESPQKSVNMEMKIEGFKYELRSQTISPKKSPGKRLSHFKPLQITLEDSPAHLEKLSPKSKLLTLENSVNIKQELETQKSKKTLFMTKKSFDMTQESISDGDSQSISSFSGEDKSKSIKTLFEKTEFHENKIVHSPEDENSNTTSSPDYNEENNVHRNALTSSAYDRHRSYIPEAGCSRTSKVLIQEKNVVSLSLTPSLEDSQLDESDEGIVSFYDTTHYQDTSFADGEFIQHSPINVSKIPSANQKSTKSSIKEGDGSAVKLHYDTSFTPEDAKSRIVTVTEKGTSKFDSIKGKKKIMVLVPTLPPPSYSEVRLTMHEHGIPLCIHEQPFYSNAKDVGNQIEVGQIILKIKSKNLTSLKPFQSDVTNSNSLEMWRENMFLTNNITQDNLNVKDLTSLLASNRPCVLTPVTRPPSAQEVNDWLKAAETRNLKREAEIPVESEKMILYFPSSPGQEMNNSQMELSLSSSSDTSTITPSPEETFVIRKRVSIVLNELDDANQEIKSTGKKRKNLSQPMRRLRPRSLRLSHARKLSIDSNDCTPKELSQGSNESDIVCGQQPEVIQLLPTIGHSQEIFLQDIEQPNQVREENMDNDQIKIGKSLSQTVDKTANHSTTLGFKFSGENYQDAPTIHENEYLTVIVLEVMTATRGDMCPDPAIDPMLAVFYCINNDCPEDHILPQQESGIIATKDGHFKAEYNETAFSYLQGMNKKNKIVFVDNEKLLFQEVLNLIAKWDPDILCGYEIEMQSWGFLFQRGFVLDMNMASKISRVPFEEKADWKRASQEINKDIKLIGRITLDVWRLLRHEIALTSYTFESVMYHIMHERVPQFSHKTLYFWWNHPSGLLKSLSMEYYLTRVTGIVHILQQLDLVGRTSELARLFGIQWYEVMSRGSQFRVESMMIRMTRPRNYVLVSPNTIQRAGMKAPEYLPLIMEPESRFYSDPVIVLDFQSLYPSMMIAYNYCFSTCLGKVNNMGRNTPFEFGCTQLKVSPRMLERLHKKDLIHWSPCGVGFVKPAVRKGVLPIMLQDILNTRLMVKRAMKKHKNIKTLQKILHSRQLGLKLIANVTYGYTAANYSGRMPCIEVADSVVAKGRETLDRAIKMVENTPRWNARVVYGDTDSLFVVIPGRSREEAFDIGAEIAEAVTNDNPTPVKLKLEKVKKTKIFHPCILQTKKRYVGYMYESKDQKTPEYLAKGIETVRRDGCPAAAKMLEKTLRILFDSCDVSKVKSYVCREFQKIIEGKCNIRDFIFAKEFRGLHNYKPGASIPALEIARQFKAQDHRKEPRDGERLPYVIVAGAPGEALLRLAHHPRDLLTDPRLRINAVYYITRAIIPPLNRCLTLLGADVNLWFAELPRKQVQLYPFLDDLGNEAENKKSTISQYFAKINCAGCETQTTGGLCETCIQNPQKTMLILQNKMNQWQRRLNLTNKICQSCCLSTHADCISVECPVLFRMSTARQDAEQIPFINKMTLKLLEF